MEVSNIKLIEDNENEPNEEQIGSEFDKESFIEAVSKFRCLWDTNEKSYKDRNVKVNSWKQLSVIFNQDDNILGFMCSTKTLKNLKDNLKKCLDRRRALTRSGAGAFCLLKCKYFDQIAFLHEKSSNKPTVSNVKSTSECTNSKNLNESNASLTTELTTLPIISQLSIPADDSSEKCKDVRINKKQKSVIEKSDNFFLKQMKDLDNRLIDSLEEKNKTVCEMSAFCNSLNPVLQGLPIKKARLAKLKINQLLFEIEFGVEYEDI
ncbi:uncharacterized protein LOC124815057 [Hydra vulgaris]|uniref:uncharacterized protein LOC124815057 n=1 Tax=Hydra vulgaris TaxID=6087 RepID=UPI0032EA1116